MAGSSRAVTAAAKASAPTAELLMSERREIMVRLLAKTLVVDGVCDEIETEGEIRIAG